MPSVVAVSDVVAANVGRDQGDAQVIEATAAAWQYACITEGRISLGDPLPEVDADALITQGLIGFARAVYLDQLAARGAQVALGDNVIDTVFNPEDIYRHWRHYFAPMAQSWGIA